MTDYTFRRVLVFDTNPGSVVRLLRNGTVTVHDATGIAPEDAGTGTVLTVAQSGSDGSASLTLTVPTVDFVSPNGFVERVTSPDAFAEASTAAASAASSASDAASAASDAAAAAALVGAPAGSAMDAYMGGSASGLVPVVNGKVDKGSLVYYAGDYASLSAAITAVPAGGRLRLAANTTYSAASLSNLSKDIIIEGQGSRSSIIDAGANAYGINLPALGTPNRITFRNVGFIGSTSGQVRLWRDRTISARFIDCRFSGFTQLAIELNGTDLLCVRCEFDGNGTPGSMNGILHQYGSERITLRDCRFRFLNRGFYCASTNGAARDVLVAGCLFDGGWMYLKATASSSGGTVTYAATTLTDTAAAFGALTLNSTVRALATRNTGTVTAIARNRLTDSAANFTTAGVRHGDIIRTATKWAVVDKVVSSTIVKVEEWFDNTYNSVEPPTVGTAYTIYKLVLGRVQSNTSTVITVDAWRDWDGITAAPAAGTLYELAPKADYQGMFVQDALKTQVSGNTFRRSWADQIAMYGQHSIVTGNEVYDGQDVGITMETTDLTAGAEVVCANNIVAHQGSAGIWSHMPGARIADNSIVDPNWMSLTTTSYAGIVLDTGASGTRLQGNLVKRVNTPAAQAKRAVIMTGTVDGVFVDNDTSGYATDLEITGTGVTNVSGRFQPNTVVLLVSSAVGPRGDFCGVGVPAIPASAGATYRRTDGGTGSSFYVKETASSSTTWAAK